MDKEIAHITQEMKKNGFNNKIWKFIRNSKITNKRYISSTKYPEDKQSSHTGEAPQKKMIKSWKIKYETNNQTTMGKVIRNPKDTIILENHEIYIISCKDFQNKSTLDHRMGSYLKD